MASSPEAERNISIGPFAVHPRALAFVSAAVALLFTGLVILLYTRDAVDAYEYETVPTGDLAFIVAAGRLVTSDDSHLLYDLPEDHARWLREKGYTFPIHYPYPPVVAYATAVFRPFDLDTTAVIWRVGVALSALVVGACVASAFSSWAWRLAMVAGVFFWQPILMNARIGQTGAFIAAFLAVAVLVFLRKRELGSILLALIAAKPTAAIGPALMVLLERPAIWLRFGLTAGAIILVPFLLLGPDSFFDWVDILLRRGWRDISGGHSYNQGISSLIGSSNIVALAGALLALVLAAAIVRAVQARMGLHVAMAFAVLGGALVNPHSLFYDWGAAFVAIMLLRKADLVPGRTADLAFGLLAISLFVVGQLTWATRHEAGDYLRPLTAWSILVCITILISTLRRYLEPGDTQSPHGQLSETPG